MVISVAVRTSKFNKNVGYMVLYRIVFLVAIAGAWIGDYNKVLGPR